MLLGIINTSRKKYNINTDASTFRANFNRFFNLEEDGQWKHTQGQATIDNKFQAQYRSGSESTRKIKEEKIKALAYGVIDEKENSIGIKVSYSPRTFGIIDPLIYPILSVLFLLKTQEHLAFLGLGILMLAQGVWRYHKGYVYRKRCMEEFEEALMKIEGMCK